MCRLRNMVYECWGLGRPTGKSLKGSLNYLIKKMFLQQLSEAFIVFMFIFTIHTVTERPFMDVCVNRMGFVHMLQFPNVLRAIWIMILPSHCQSPDEEATLIHIYSMCFLQGFRANCITPLPPTLNHFKKSASLTYVPNRTFTWNK